MLRDADGREVESNTDVAGDSEQSGMQTAMTIDQENVRSPFHATNGCLDSRKLTISQVCRDVWKLGGTSHRGDFDRSETLGVDTGGRDIHSLSIIARIDAGDAVEVLPDVVLDHAVAEIPLLLPECGEKAHGGQPIEDSVG